MTVLIGIVFVVLLVLHILHAILIKARTNSAEEKPHVLTTLVMSVAPFVVICCSGVRRVTPRLTFAVFAQTALLVVACYLGARQGVFSRQLVSPVYIGIGLLAGHLIFGLSLLATQHSIRDAAVHFVDFGSIWEFTVESPAVLMQFITVGIAEELIYRVGAQPLLIQWTGSAFGGIVLVALGFSCAHEHFFKNPFRQSVEFFGFSLLLGGLYYFTGSLILVIVIHAVRNIEIAFLEYLIRVEESGGEEQAALETDFVSGHRILVLLALAVRDIEVACLEYSAGPDPVAPPHHSSGYSGGVSATGLREATEFL